MPRKGSITIRVALLVIVLLCAACAKTVRMPPEDWDAGVKPDTYRIRLHGRVEYLVGWYTVTDSTVVIQELLPSDQRFAHGREQLPIVIPREQVVSIGRTGTNWWLTVPLATAAVAGAVYFFYLLSTL